MQRRYTVRRLQNGWRNGSSTSQKALQNRRVLSMDLTVERESQFNAAGDLEFHVRNAAVLNDR